MKQIDTKTYQKEFDAVKGATGGPICAEALKQALDIRKFEIGLYWQRAAYFWAFISAAFVGYGVAQGIQEQSVKTDLSVLVGCIGLVFSFAWYCVNRGSKKWQMNWEYHVDLLEDDVMGPLYKTVISSPPPQGLSKKAKSLLVGPGNFSASKINQIVSVFVTVLWALLLVHALLPFNREAKINWYYILLPLVSLMAVFLMLVVGRTSENDSSGVAMKRESTLQSIKTEEDI